MFYQSPEIVHPAQQGIEFVGTFVLAISGTRHTAAKNSDWFDSFVYGVTVAISGGTIRGVMIEVTSFRMTSSIYIICTVLVQLFIIVFSKFSKRLGNIWFVSNTSGLALSTTTGIQKSLAYDFLFWATIIMGHMTGSVGGVIRDALLNNIPIIFQKRIYTMTNIIDGVVYWALVSLDVNVSITMVSSFLMVCAARFLAVRHHLSSPRLRLEEQVYACRQAETG